MPSNALSQKSFSTKTPVICKAPPWPPFVPPPPLPKAVFFCFASFKHSGWPNVPIFAASCSLYFNPTLNNWTGTSSGEPTSPWISTTLRITPDEKSYYLRVEYHWPPHGGIFVEWSGTPWSTKRPYVGQTLTSYHTYYQQNRTANVRESPA